MRVMTTTATAVLEETAPGRPGSMRLSIPTAHPLQAIRPYDSLCSNTPSRSGEIEISTLIAACRQHRLSGLLLSRADRLYQIVMAALRCL
jgi:hypothetical protein